MVISFQTIPVVHVTAYYVIRNSQGQAWRNDLSSWENWLDANRSLYSLALSESGTSGFYAGPVPAAVPSGTYTIVAYHQAGGSPASGDTILTTQTITIQGATTFNYGLVVDAIDTFTAEFGESIIYTPYRGTAAQYRAVVFRDVPVTIAGLTGASAYKHEVFIPNDPSGSFGPSSIQKGNDTVTFANRLNLGEASQTYTVVEVLAQDPGMWHLGIGSG